MAFATIGSPKIVAESNCIYANGWNQMKITVSFDAYDEKGNSIVLTDLELFLSVWLIDFNATSADPAQNLGANCENGGPWLVETNPGPYNQYPADNTLRRRISSDQHDAANSISFYACCNRYVSSVQIGFVIRTSEHTYTCSSRQLGDEVPYKTPATFSLLPPITYNMSNCSVTADSDYDGAVNGKAWIYYLAINDPTGYRKIVDMKAVNNTRLVNVTTDDMDVPTWWAHWASHGKFDFLFPFTSQPGQWTFHWPGSPDPIYMDTFPYNRGGNSITLISYKYKSGVSECTAPDLNTPIFEFHDQFGNSGRFSIETSQAETDWLHFIDG